uniref:ATP synthase complex subunit 8 n=1 Tax=Corydalus cornutus TaxID=559164 RepID=B5U4C6_CORCG|nr:ATP synthase F0 subunit 8 [Corydalus cornutus]ACH89978.1 ATP synthase F0 subunit 8 [Corydalus cornutus]
MPQMAPINWLLLFILFSMILILFNIMNYFITMPASPELTLKNFKKNNFNWKW